MDPTVDELNSITTVDEAADWAGVVDDAANAANNLRTALYGALGAPLAM